MTNYRQSEQGSVIVWILIAVAAFAALSFAVSNISRSGGTSMQEVDRLRATDIMQYAGAVQRGIRIMRINGTDDDAICFHTALWGNTLYDDSSDDNDCGTATNRVFDHAGGDIGFQPAVIDWYTGDISLANGDKTWVFSSRYEVEDVGTTSAGTDTVAANADLLMATAPVSDQVCEQLNLLLGYTDGAPPTVAASTYDNLATTPFNTNATSFADGSGRIGPEGRERCVNDGTSNIYYKVILAR